MELNQLRQQIDQVDEQLVALFVQRMALSAQVAAYKKERNLPILVPQREHEKLESVAAMAGELGDYAHSLYEAIMALSRDYQAERNGEKEV